MDCEPEVSQELGLYLSIELLVCQIWRVYNLYGLIKTKVNTIFDLLQSI